MSKIPIHFSEQDEKDIAELAKMLGNTGVFGETPKSIKFGIRLALGALANPQKVYSYLNDDELTQYFTSRARIEKLARATQKAEKIVFEAKKV